MGTDFFPESSSTELGKQRALHPIYLPASITGTIFYPVLKAVLKFTHRNLLTGTEPSLTFQLPKPASTHWIFCFWENMECIQNRLREEEFIEELSLSFDSSFWGYTWTHCISTHSFHLTRLAALCPVQFSACGVRGNQCLLLKLQVLPGVTCSPVAQMSDWSQRWLPDLTYCLVLIYICNTFALKENHFRVLLKLENNHYLIWLFK